MAGSPPSIRSISMRFPVFTGALPPATSPAGVPRPSGRLTYGVPVVGDHVADLLGVHPGVRSGIGDRATEAHIVAYDVGPVRILEQVIDVCLAYTVVPVEVTSIVGLVPIGHCISSE